MSIIPFGFEEIKDNVYINKRTSIKFFVNTKKIIDPITNTNKPPPIWDREIISYINIKSGEIIKKSSHSATFAQSKQYTKIDIIVYDDKTGLMINVLKGEEYPPEFLPIINKLEINEKGQLYDRLLGITYPEGYGRIDLKFYKSRFGTLIYDQKTGLIWDYKKNIFYSPGIYEPTDFGYYFNRQNKFYYDPTENKIINMCVNKQVPNGYYESVSDEFYKSEKRGFFYHLYTGLLIYIERIDEIHQLKYNKNTNTFNKEIYHMVIPHGYDTVSKYGNKRVKYYNKTNHYNYYPSDGFIYDKNDNYIYYFNPLLNTLITVNEEIIRSIITNLQNDLHPYQTQDMISKGNIKVKFAKRENILQYINSNLDVLKKLIGQNIFIVKDKTGKRIKCLLDTPSAIDIHKIKRNCPKYGIDEIHTIVNNIKLFYEDRLYTNYEWTNNEYFFWDYMIAKNGNFIYDKDDIKVNYNKKEIEKYFIKLNNIPLSFELDESIKKEIVEKLNEECKKYNYKYLFQIDDTYSIPKFKCDLNQKIDWSNKIIAKKNAALNSMPFIKKCVKELAVRELNDKEKDKSKYITIFVPYLGDSIFYRSKPNIKYHQNYKVNIANEPEFIKYLDSKFIDDLRRKRKIIYDLKNLFSDIQKFNKDKLFEKNILKIEYDRLTGLNPEKINDVFNNMLIKLEKLDKNKNIPLLCDNSLLLSETLYKQSSENFDDHKYFLDYEKKKQICTYNKMNLEKFKIILENNMKKKFDIMSICSSSDFEFVPEDNINNATNINCQQIINNIKDNDDLKGILQKINNEYTKSLTEEQLNIGKTKDISNFELLEKYMPEWYTAILENDLDKALKNRQTIFGKDEYTNQLKRCSLFIRSDPFISASNNIPNVSWNIDINKALTSCIINNDLVFPLRLIWPLRLLEDPLQMYDTFYPNDKKNKILIGSLLIKTTGPRFGKNNNKYYNTFIYYDAITNKLNYVNFRANKHYENNIFEYVKILYLELNVLKYFKDDIKSSFDIHLYRYSDTNTIFFSRYSYEELIRKYEEFNKINNKLSSQDIIDKLTEYTIEKDQNKFIYLKKKIIEKNQVGGIKSSKFFNLISLKHNIIYTWNIIYEPYNNNFDSLIFQTSLFNKYNDLVYNMHKKMGDSFYSIADISSYYYFLTFSRKDLISKFDYSDVNEYDFFTKQNYIILKDIKSNIYKMIYKDDKLKLDNILSYQFQSIFSTYFFEIVNRFNFINDKSNIMIFCKNIYALEAVLYYQKYKLYKKNTDNIILFSYIESKFNTESTRSFTKYNNIKYTEINEPLSNNNPILNTQYKMCDLVILDLNLNILKLHDIRTNYNFQTLIPQFIVALKHLNKNGSIILYIWNITNQMVFDFILFISTMFEEMFIYNPSIPRYGIYFTLFVFKNYKQKLSDNDLSNLMKLNEQNFKYDPTGGQNYKVVSKNNPSIDTKYLYKIFDIEGADKLYKKYHDHITNIYTNRISFLNEVDELYKNYNNITYLTRITTNNIVYAIAYATDIDLPIADWVDPKKFKGIYYENAIKDLYKNINEILIPFSKHEDVPIILSDNINNNEKEVNILYILHESTYKYMEKINIDKFKQIELYVNSNQKKLQKYLFREYDINIKNEHVSRAWIKFFTLLSKTNFFNKIEKDRDMLNSFYICEAPGNFIAATKYYVENYTKFKQFIWHAQSLKESKIYDHYGFIKSNPDKWDFGQDLSGDITKYNNLLYYIKKYKGVDIVIGDCGVAWQSTKSKINLGTYQLLYDLLIPRIGGNFVLKTYASNIDIQYISLLYLACIKYEELYVFKSSRNFWSPEIYIVGKGFKGLKTNEEQVLLDIFKGLEKGQILYPVKEIPKDFVDQYIAIMSKIIRKYKMTKKFFVYLVRNPDKYKKLEQNMVDVVDQQNKRWIEKFIVSNRNSKYI